MQDSIKQLRENIDSVQMKMDALLNYFSGMEPLAATRDDLTHYEFVALVLDTIIWPLVLLFILISFKREFGGIFDRAKSLSFTPSGIQIETFEETFNKVKELGSVVTNKIGKSKSMMAPPDPFGPTDPNMIVAKVQIDLDQKLRKRASTSGITIKGMDTKDLNNKLREKGVITAEENKLIVGLIELTDAVMSGHKVNHDQAGTILDIYKKLP